MDTLDTQNTHDTQNNHMNNIDDQHDLSHNLQGATMPLDIGQPDIPSYISSAPSVEKNTARQQPASPDTSSPTSYVSGQGGQPPYAPQYNQNISPQPPKKRRWTSLAALALSALVIFGAGLFSGWQFATRQTNIASPTASSITSNNTTTSATSQSEAAIAKVKPAVVELDVTTAQGEDIGSGVIINSNGDIVTNNHVVAGAVSIKAVLNSGTTETAQLVATRPSEDLALVQIQPVAHMAVETIGNSSSLTVGQTVLAIGNPLGINETVTNGIVSAVNRSVQEPTGATIANAIQTDAPINPGNSGGALINLQGQLVGIPTLASIDQETGTIANGIGFAIPSNTVQQFVNSVLSQQ
jgi:S1-C subfamily serine protease